MCGIAGIWHFERERPVDRDTLAWMAAAIRHRGPDGWGLYQDGHVGFAHLRLSIVDLSGGWQPMATEDESLVVTYNGEIFNWQELRRELEAHGHRFRTQCDTEVLLHGYRQWGEGMLERLNGDFAFALHDRAHDRLLLARDRVGVRPLFYAEAGRSLYFASEVKALLATGAVPREVDPDGLEEVFTMWGAQPPRTPFAGVRCLPPGHLAVVTPDGIETRPYYTMGYAPVDAISPRDAVERVGELMTQSTRLRMRADVPVGAYLSGGLDSSLTSTLASKESPITLSTFSVTFAEPHLNEAEFQRQVAEDIRTQHYVVEASTREIAHAFPKCVWHTETPLLRTAPTPLMLLAERTRQAGIVAVLTGEGADEGFLGYDLFKELRVRLFCARQPESRLRPYLLQRLYPYFAQNPRRAGEFWRRFFLEAGDPHDALASHAPRFMLTARVQDFLTADARGRLSGEAVSRLRDTLPPGFAAWDPLHRAAYLEIRTLMSPYLLSSQGDRVASAHAVEGRFPFLDPRVLDYAASLPAKTKLRGLKEKAVLRDWAERVLPASVANRPKQPYRAPDGSAFIHADAPEYVDEILSEGELRRVGWFEPQAVAGLVRRCRDGRPIGYRENMALVAAVSTQLWHRQFITDFHSPDPETLGPPRVVLEPRALHRREPAFAGIA